MEGFHRGNHRYDEKNQVDLMKILINSRVKSKIDKPNPVVGGTRRSRTRALT